MIQRFTKQQNITDNDISVQRKRIYGTFDMHWHEFFEIEYIIEGSGEYCIDGITYQIRPGMIFFMTPINFHELKNVSAEIINIMFSHDFSTPDALFPISGHGIEHAVKFNQTDAVFIETLLTELCHAAKEKDTVYTSALLSSLLFKLGRTAKKNFSAGLTYVQTVMLYLQNNFRSRITLSEAAASVGLSPSYLSGIFSKEAGIGFKEYLNTLRFEYAKKLLLFSDMSVSEICFDSGFDDYANFLRSFKQRYGISPGQFKKERKPQISSNA
ncbi:MAG: AraC family transcriptional regulator [Clostridia bacterium]|nr:AraC family transcriptional regulator [Clostridia bacterium]